MSIAQSAIANNAAQSSLISQNIANVNSTNYSRKTAQSITLVGGNVQTATTQRATNDALLTKVLSSTSASAASSALSDGLTSIADTLNLDQTPSATSTSTAVDNSPSTMIGALSDALQQYASEPDNSSLASAAVTAAQSLATNLNQASAAVQTVREQSDSSIATSVQTINSLLSQFQTVNNQIVAGTQAGADVSDAQDTRDGILKQLSNEIGITTTQSSNGSMQIYTDSGVTLFETTPRSVTFTPTSTYTANTVGQAVMVDGVPVTGSSAVMPISSGTLYGLTQLRDTTSVDYQNQLDQMASSLISTFSESDQTGSGAPTLPGLFTAPGLTAMPTSITGLAASITINASVDPSQGGVATRLRDGNISSSNPAYTYNTPDASGVTETGYSDRLTALDTALNASSSFDPSTGGEATGSLASYAASSASWLEAARQTATNNGTYNSSVVSSATTALSNATGVNIDEELSNMLDIEHAYQASAQLMNTVNTMYSSLLQAFA